MKALKAISPLGWLLLISFLVRLVLAAIYPLNNDEAYYYVYAKFPDWSHFDHPGMVGWIIQVFSLNLLFDAEWIIRMPALISSTINTWIIYKISLLVSDKKAAFFSALLYTFTIYGFIVAGTFILPDALQSTFWLAAIYFLITCFFKQQSEKQENKNMILGSIFIALAMMSKYTSIFLWIGFLVFIVVYKQKWLKRSSFYIGQIIILISLLPTLIWNIKNNFISFGFHSDRVVVENVEKFSLDSFIQAIVGNILYINPVIWVLILIVVIVNFKSIFQKKASHSSFLLIVGLPLIITFLAVSLFRNILPHWNSLGYITLIILVSEYLTKLKNQKNILKFAASYLVLFIIIVPLQISTGFIPLEKISNKDKADFSDFSLDLYGWKKLNKEFLKISSKYEADGTMKQNSPILSSRWFPAANFEYYIERKSPNYSVYALSDTINIHEYLWINHKKAPIEKGMDAYYITSSIDYQPLGSLTGIVFGTYNKPDTISIYRCNKKAYDFYVFRMNNILYCNY